MVVMLAAAAAAVDFLDNTVTVCCVGEIILGDVSVKVELEPAVMLRSEVVFAVKAAVDASDGVVTVTIDEIVGSFNVVVADVTAISAAVDVAAVIVAAAAAAVVVIAAAGDEEGGEEDDDKCEVAFFGNVAFAIGLDAVVAVITVASFPPPPIGVVFFPLVGSSGRTFGGTASTVVNSANQTHHLIARILGASVRERERETLLPFFSSSILMVRILDRDYRSMWVSLVWDLHIITRKLYYFARDRRLIRHLLGSCSLLKIIICLYSIVLYESTQFSATLFSFTLLTVFFAGNRRVVRSTERIINVRGL